MRLKRLTVHGFKSFADRTIFRFEGSGLTAIVGPNGCGKSNVLEAIKWVLGEQRPTSLRSREMTDVIFNGTVRRPPMGLCQGTLLFGNEDRTLPIDADEVLVSRRVTRGGETDYQINGQACRLKDIRQLFAGTGLGAGGYGFMEQGKIDSVLASNPHERRKVFEEAAGISRFRARRHETELKLRRVEDNLTRLADIVEEITRQIRSLKIHAGKARNHRAMSARVRALSLAFSVNRCAEIEAEREELAQRLAELDGERKTALEARDEAREEHQRLEARVEQAAEELGALRTRRAEIDGQLGSARQKLEFQEGYLAQIRARQEKKTEDIARGEGAVRELEARIEEARKELAELEGRREEVLGTLARQDEEARGVRERVEELERALATVEQRLIADDRALAEKARVEARADADLETNAQRIGEAREREEGLSAELESARTALEEGKAVRDAGEIALAKARETFEAAVQALTTAETAAREARAAITPAREARDRARARHSALQGVLSRREALDDGPRKLLALAEKSPELVPGVIGLALDALRFDDPERARALETAFGESAGAILVNSTAEALAILEVVRERKLPEVLLLPADALPAPDTLPDLGVRPHGPHGERVLSALLSGVQVLGVEDWERKLSDGEVRALSTHLVSDDGRAVRPGGLLTRRRGSRSSLVHVQSETQALEREMPALDAAFETASAALAAAEQALREGRETRSAAESELGQIERDAARARDDVQARAKAVDRLVEEGEGLLNRLAHLAEHREGLEKRVESVRAERKEIAARVEADREGLHRERERLTEFARQRDEAATKLEQARIEAATLGERWESLTTRLNGFESTMQDITERREADHGDVQELEEARATCEETITAVGEDIATGEASLEEVVQTLEGAEETHGVVRGELEGVGERLRGLEDLVEEAGSTLGDLRAREGGLDASAEALVERARDELDLEDLPGFTIEVLERLAKLEPAAAEVEEDAEEKEDEIVAAEEAEDHENSDEEVAAQDESSEDDTDEEDESDASEDGEVAEADGFAAPAAESAEEDEEEPEPAIDDEEVVMQQLLLDEATDWKAVEREVRQLREKIARLGNVNLAAVEELEEAEERSRMIFSERDDLDESRARLGKILKNLEEQSTELFVKTFDDVSHHFSEIFRRLFGGGKAEMFLENPAAPLESGIEIKARPPGKEFRSITLLSGGERTMTAVALLFAIFRANPAPCAFLDEVDAALDEDNIERFCSMVKDFTDRSQFVVVTHSKRTMEAAELLYGVTMPERGVSRRVAVRVEHLDEEGNFKDVDAMNEAARVEEAEEPSAETDALPGDTPGDDAPDGADAHLVEDPPERHELLEMATVAHVADASDESEAEDVEHDDEVAEDTEEV